MSSAYKYFEICFFVQLYNNFIRNVITLAYCVISALSYFWLNCYCGEFITNIFLKYADCLYKSQWYSLPVPLEKYWTIVMPNMQRTVFYDGLGMVRLNLNTFANVSPNPIIWRFFLFFTVKNFIDCFSFSV